MKTARTIAICLVGAVLAFGILVQLGGLASKRKEMVAADLETLIPKSLPGWEATDHPLADSPELQKRVEGILNFDAALFRTYRKGDKELSVYAAYWLPGKVHYQNVDTHTPDVCWVENGWQMERLSSLESRSVNGVEVELPNTRIFRIGASRITVLFWHIEGNVVRESRSRDESRISFWERASIRMANLLSTLRREPEQQLFIRLSSNGNVWEDLEEAPTLAVLEWIAEAKSGKRFYSLPAK